MPKPPINITVQVTANFERNLDDIEPFLIEAQAPQAYEALLDELAEPVIPNLERFPDMGRLFMARPAGSVEGRNGLDDLRNWLGEGELREDLLADYLILYVRYASVIYLLSIKHHRQLSFDLAAHWQSTRP